MYDDYMNTEELAKFIGVSKSLVEKWRRKGWLMPDVIGHDRRGRAKTYYYSKEHVLQLASVYVNENSENLSDNFNPVHFAYTSDDLTNENCDQTATTYATEEEPNQTVAVLATDKQSFSCGKCLNSFQLYAKIRKNFKKEIYTKRNKGSTTPQKRCRALQVNESFI